MEFACYRKKKKLLGGEKEIPLRRAAEHGCCESLFSEIRSARSSKIICFENINYRLLSSTETLLDILCKEFEIKRENFKIQTRGVGIKSFRLRWDNFNENSIICVKLSFYIIRLVLTSTIFRRFFFDAYESCGDILKSIVAAWLSSYAVHAPINNNLIFSYLDARWSNFSYKIIHSKLHSKDFKTALKSSRSSNLNNFMANFVVVNVQRNVRPEPNTILKYILDELTVVS